MDIATTAGGGRTITMSISDISLINFFFSTREYLLFLIKRWALWIDLEAYLTHGAKIAVIANHKYCGKCPQFESSEAEDKYHIEILVKAGKKLLKKYSQIKEVILLYVIIDKETHEALKVVEAELNGETKTIIIKEEEKLAFKEKELKMLKLKRNNRNWQQDRVLLFFSKIF